MYNNNENYPVYYSFFKGIIRKRELKNVELLLERSFKIIINLNSSLIKL